MKEQQREPQTRSELSHVKKKRNHSGKSLGEMCQIVTIEHAAGDADFNFFVYVFLDFQYFLL